MKMNKIKILVLTFLSIVLIGGCSNKDETAEGKDEVDKIFEETDEVAMEFYKAGFELNIPKAYEMLSPKGKEELEQGEYKTEIVKDDNTPLFVNSLIDKADYEEYKSNYADQFKDFNRLNEEYEIRRYDNVYNKEEGEIVYYVSPWSSYEMEKSDFNFISLKKNDEGTWKVKTYKEGIPDQIDDWESGKVIHKYEKDEEQEDDGYGFDNE